MPLLFEAMADGKNVTEVCAEYGWPRVTVNMWAHSPKWRAQYLQAKEALGSVQGEAVLIAAQAAADARDYVRIQGLRVLVDALKWSAAKHHRRVYGDNQQVEVVHRQGVIALPDEQDPVLGPLEKARVLLGAKEGEEVSVEPLAPEEPAEG